MRKLVVLCLLFAGVAWAGTPDNVTVSTNSVQLVPSRPIHTDRVDTWVTSTSYAAGSVVKNGYNHYFTVAGGTSGGTAPTHTTGATSDGGVTWRFVMPGKRNGVTVSVKTSGGAVDLSLGTDAAVANGGIRLTGEGHAILFSLPDDYQGAIHAIRVSADTVVGVQEF